MADDVTKVLGGLLSLTQPDEMDCDTFASLVAEHVEGLLEGEVAELFEHHRRICPECDEELQALKLALGI